MLSDEKEVSEKKDVKEILTKKTRRKRVAKEEKKIPLETIDTKLRPKKAKAEVSAKQEPSVPETEVTFPEGTRVIDESYAIKMLRDANYRQRNSNDKVAYLGRGKQRYFVLELTSWMVVRDGILFVPVKLAEFKLLETWKRLKGKAPKGFVAFQRR